LNGAADRAGSIFCSMAYGYEVSDVNGFFSDVKSYFPDVIAIFSDVNP